MFTLIHKNTFLKLFGEIRVGAGVLAVFINKSDTEISVIRTVNKVCLGNGGEIIIHYTL